MLGTPRLTPGYLEVIFITLLVAAGLVYGYDRYLAPKVLVIDLKDHLRQQQNLLSSGAISEAQWQEGLDALEQTLRAQPENRIILLKDMVLHHGKNSALTIK